MNRRLTVSHTLDNDGTLQSSLRSLGMDAKAVADVSSSAGPGAEQRPAIPRLTWILMSLSGAIALLAEGVAWTSEKESSQAVIALALISIAAGGRDTLRKGWISLRTLTLNINFLMTVAIFGAVCIGQWPEAAMVTFLFGVAEMIEALSLDRARNAIRGLMEMSPETATVQSPGGGWQEMPAAEVQVGQTVRVKPGERIPLDGEIISGVSSVNQAPITAKACPWRKSRATRYLRDL